MIHQSINLAKYGWIALIVLGVTYYLARNYRTLTRDLQTVSLPSLLMACCCLIATKLILVEVSRRSVFLASDKQISYRQMFFINSISQLAKYLPGGIWHFVGRASSYHSHGMSKTSITRAMIIENIWLVMSALLTGVIFLLLNRANDGTDVVVTLIGGAVLWVSMLRLTGEQWSFSPINLLLQLSVWVLAGLALWFVMLASDAEQGLLAIGAFAASWAVGYLTIFAPGGLGVREVVLVVMLATVLPTNEGLVYSTIHRFLWIITEVILGLGAMRLDMKRGLEDE